MIISTNTKKALHLPLPPTSVTKARTDFLLRCFSLLFFVALLVPGKSWAQATTIDYYNLQYPFTATINTGGNMTAYAQLYINGITATPGVPPGINCWIGYSSNNVNPADPSFTWVVATYNTQSGNNDEYQATFGSNLPAGTYYFASRFQRNNGVFYYGGLQNTWNGTSTPSGVLTVNCSVNAPTGSASQSFSAGATVADLSAAGAGIQWYADPNGGSPLAGTVALVDNTHYYASQTVNGCESVNRLNVTATVGALPTNIDYYNLQYPPSANIGVGGNMDAYAQVYTAGVTEAPGAPAGISCWIGYSSNNVNPSDPSFTWVAASYNAQSGNNDEYKATFGSTLPGGTYYYVSRFQRNGGIYYYGGTGGAWGGSSVSGVLTITCAAAPTGNASQSFISGSTVADLVANGQNIKWYDSPSGGSLLSSSTLLQNNTHYYASQTVGACESAQRLDVTVTFLATTLTYYNLQYPPSATITTGGNITAYAQVYEQNVTEAAGAAPGVTCWIGYSSNNVNPSDPSFTWVTASYNNNAGNNDEYQLTFGNTLAAGTYYYASRFQRNGGIYYYGGTQGPWGGSSISGVLTVNCNVPPPTGNSSQSLLSGSTVNDLIASGSNVQWFAGASGGTALPSSTLLTDGTHYYAEQSSNGCVSSSRLDVTVTLTALPSTIDYVNLQYPPSGSIPVGGSFDVYAQIYTSGLTEAAGAPAGISSWIGYSSSNVNPADPSFTWVAASYNTQAGNNDEYKGTFGSNLPAGVYYYASRFQRNGGAYYYGGTQGFWGGSSISGVLYINCSPAPSGSSSQSFMSGATVADLVAGGTAIQWYATATGGSPLSNSVVLVNNTHYYASQTVSGCESSERLDVTVTILPSNIDYYNLQYPPSAAITVGGSVTAYAQVYIGGVTEAQGPAAGISAWIGYSSSNVNPADPSFTWVPATYNTQAGNNDEYQATFGSNLAAGTYYYASRFQRNGGIYYYGGTQGAWGGSSISGVLTISCPSTPLAAPVVTGIANVCPYINTGTAITYTANSAGASGYNWQLPANVILQSSTQNSISVTFVNGFATQPNKQIRVTALSSCGNSPIKIFYVMAQVPGTPGSITGSTNVCPVIGTAATLTFTIPSVLGAVSYVWTAQAGTTTISHPNGPGVNDTTVTVSFTNEFTSSNITVAAAGCNGVSAARSLAITKANPATPGLIAGPRNVCANIAPGGMPASYSVAAAAGISYTWTAPAGAIGLDGQGSSSVSFTYPNGFTNGTVLVTATNGCGTSTARSLDVNKLNPSTPSVIDVIQTNSCPSRTYSYSISATPLNSTSLNWTVPATATLVSGQGTNTIIVSYPSAAVSGAVTVQAISNCGVSTIRSTSVKLPACAAGKSSLFAKGSQAVPSTNTEASEKMRISVFPNPSTSNFNIQVLTAGKEMIHIRILDMQGRVFKSMTVQPYQAISIGTDLLPGVYIVESKQSNNIVTTKLVKF